MGGFAPESQTLSILSFEPDTIVLPSGEKANAHSDVIWSVDFSPDGSKIVSGSSDKTIKVWNLKTKKKVFGGTKSEP